MNVDCPYCGEPLAGTEVHEEHFLARALGWPVTTPAHLSCGHALNRLVEEPVMKDFWVTKLRSDYGIRGRHGEVPKAPRLPATDASGERVLAEFLPFARIDVRRLDADRTPLRGRKRLTFSDIRISVAWPRVMAKLALGVGSFVADAEWQHSATAHQLREVLWTDRPSETELELALAPGSAPEGYPVRRALLPPEILVWTSHTVDGRASICLALFDDDVFAAAPLAMTPAEGQLVRDYAWLVDPRRARVVCEGDLDTVSQLLERRRPQVARIRAAVESALGATTRVSSAPLRGLGD